MSVFNSKKNYFIFYIIIFIGALTVKGRNVTSEKSVLTKVFEKFHKFVHLSENFHRFPMKYPHPAYERLPKNVSRPTVHQHLLKLLQAYGVNQQCITDMLHLNIGLEKREDWALRMVDAFGKPNAGIVNIGFRWRGSFDECEKIHASGHRSKETGLVIPVTASAAGYALPEQRMNFENYDISGQYCMAYQSLPMSYVEESSRFRVLETYPPYFGLGTCLPNTCGVSDIIRMYKAVAGQMLDTDGSDVSVLAKCVTATPISTAGIIVLVVTGIIGVAIAMGTTYDLLVIRHQLFRKDNKQQTHDESIGFNETNGSQQITTLNGATEYPDSKLVNGTTEKHIDMEMVNKKTFDKPQNKLEKVLLCFSVIRSSAEVFTIEESKSRIDALEGIRFLSMSWIILIHTNLYGAPNSANVTSYYASNTSDWTFLVLFQPYCVDSFFVLSGFLVSYLCLKKLEKVGSVRRFYWGLFYLLRFWRMIPTFYLIFFIYWKVYWQMTYGPYWTSDNDNPNSKVYACQKLWWSTLLFFNNVYGGQDLKECYGESWYLAADTQFYILSPLFIIPLYLYPKIGLALASTFVAASSIAVGTISHLFEYVPLLSAIPIREKDTMYMPWMHYYPISHFGPYLIGMMAGWLLYKRRCSINIPKIATVIGWCMCFVAVSVVVYGPYRGTLEIRDMDISVIGSFYMAIAKPLWACAISWIIIACATGNGGFINTILSWKPYIVLGRLTFCTYLVHPMVLWTYFNKRSTPLFRTDIEMGLHTVSFVTISYALGFIVSVCVERPTFALKNLLFRNV